MNAKGFIAVLVLASLVGCSNRYHHQVDQSLLLKENQRLENALYVKHTQLVNMKRENDRLKTMLGQSDSSITPRRGQPMERRPTDSYDEAPPYEPPKVSAPPVSPSTTLPDIMKGSVLPPKTKVATKSDPDYFPPTTVTEPTKEEPPTGPVFPEWTPNR